MTTNLFALQEKFLASVYQATTTQFLQHLAPHTRLSAATQFAIYRNSIFGRLQKALREIYPVCHQLVGVDFFSAMAAEFILQTPSTSPDLNTYGATFDAFIVCFPPAVGLPYLADIATLEWAWHRLYGAPNSQPLDFEKLATQSAIHGEDICFCLPARSTLLSSPYPIDQIWTMNQSDNENTTITLVENHMYYFLIWHHHHVLQITPLTIVEWQLLTWFQQALPFGKICEQAETHFPEVNITALLPEFVKRGWLVDSIVLTSHGE